MHESDKHLLQPSEMFLFKCNRFWKLIDKVYSSEFNLVFQRDFLLQIFPSINSNFDFKKTVK